MKHEPISATTDLVPHTDRGEIVNPRTGVVVTPDSNDDDVIDFLTFLRDAGAELAALDGEISQWLRERADARGKWTLAGGRASMPSDKDEITWNKIALVALLEQLAAESAITWDELEEIAPLVREVHIAKVNLLLGRALPAVVARIKECQVHVPKRSRPVKVR